MDANKLISDKKHRKTMNVILIIIFVALVFIIAGCIAFVGRRGSKSYIKHVRAHLTSISTNRKLPDGKYNIVFYRDDCPHCQRVVPRAYVYNKLHMHNDIQYRDIARNNYNYDLSISSHVQVVPSRAIVEIKNGNVVHYKVTSHLT